MQATKWPGPISLDSGTTAAQSPIAFGQRVRNTHPEGGLTGLGMSPDNTLNFWRCEGSFFGTADKRA